MELQYPYREPGQRSLCWTRQGSSVDLMHCSLITAKAAIIILDINWFHANRHTSTHQWRLFIKHTDGYEFSPLLHTTCGPSTVQPLETHLFRLTAQLTLSVMDPFGGHPGAITNRVEGKILTNVV
jgi:hypothetical protein